MIRHLIHLSRYKLIIVCVNLCQLITFRVHEIPIYDFAALRERDERGNFSSFDWHWHGSLAWRVMKSKK